MSENRDPAGRRGLEDRFGYSRAPLTRPPGMGEPADTEEAKALRRLIVDLRRYLDPGRRMPPYSFNVTNLAQMVLEAYDDRIEIWIFNLGAATVYIGNSGRLIPGAADQANAGFPIGASSGLIIDKGARDELWAVSGTTGQDLRVIEIRAREVIGERRVFEGF